MEYISKVDVSDVMIERPISFSIKSKHYSVYPATLGKVQLTARLLEKAGIDKLDKSENLYRTLLEKAKECRDDCLRIIAYSTIPGAGCLDENLVQARLSELSSVDNVDIASLLVSIITQDKYELIYKQFSMDTDAKRMAQVMKVKSSSNSISFGARSVWGALIDAACERYGWTYQYVLWGVSYCNLRLMLADQSRSVFLTEEERRQIPVSNDREIVRAEDVDALNALIKSRSWK